MAKDERLYARFDIGMDEHPKIMLLSDAAFRTLFEATLFSRRQMTDGFLADGVVRRRWSVEAISELQSNDPERPSFYPFTKAGVTGLMIHDFEKHQTTTADIEAKREAGRKGGLAKAKQTSSRSVAPAREMPLAESKQTSSAPLAITETETETETEASLPVGEAKLKEHRLPKDWVPSKTHYDLASERRVDITAEATAFRLHAETHDRHAARWNAAFTTWLKKSKPVVPQSRNSDAWMNQ